MARKLKQSLARYQAAKQYEEARARKANHASIMKTRQKEAQAARARAAARKDWVPFTDDERVLLVGEGDFSFALALQKKNSSLNILATGYDSAEEVGHKYPHSAELITELEANGALVAHDIDATRLRSCKLVQDFAPSKVVFNFPHLGNSVSDVDRNIIQHQKLLLGFFEECRALDALVVLTLFAGEPYDSWEAKRLARNAGYAVQRSQAFNKETWPGYAHQLTRKGGARTATPQNEREARMYLFEPKHGDATEA